VSISPAKTNRRTTLFWLVVGLLFLLCGVLGVLQYRWIGEVSLAARDRLRGSLQTNLNRLSADFSSEIATACRAFMPVNAGRDEAAAETEMAARFEEWRKTAHGPMFRHIAIAAPQQGGVTLRNLDFERGIFETVDWPQDWGVVRQRTEARFSSEARGRRGPPGPPAEQLGMIFDFPLFSMGPGGPGGTFGRFESPSLILELNAEYARETILPELLQRHLEPGGSLEYQVQVMSRANPPRVLYESDPGARIAGSEDASVALFEPQYDQVFGRGGRGQGRGQGQGRWLLLVRHRAGSLEAVVARSRWRSLAVTAGVLLLMVASLAALIHYTRRAQRLAELQMDFVAGVSHELRTPLTVIHTAAYNLRGKLAANPAQVEKYGALIQQESGRLKDMVEQVLRFASANAGRLIQERKPLSVESVIQETVESSQAVLQGAGCVVEESIDAGLPLVMGDAQALKQALQNLLHNAAKYGSEGSHWIGVSASKTGSNGEAAVEIRVADRGPGIPADEQAHVFDPFFRGRRALQGQVHGTGLGLNLTRKIVEAHGGTIRVKSEPMKGTEFVVRIPAAPEANQGANQGAGQ
jgi:signal transduction histidine kinase